MGRGNYLPVGGNFELIYVDFPLDLSTERMDCWYANLLRDVSQVLPASFCEDDRWINHDGHVRFSNRLLDVAFADNEWSEALFIIPRKWNEEREVQLVGLAGQHMGPAYRWLGNGLLDRGYKLYTRSGPWTSSELKEKICSS